ncbi:MAG: branched-chain-amino-acid transaminase [Sphaerochaeta sp.]|jgi:branched-chain amino acid aminotransferase|nr:branched-chain-amino-acid transaminase [Sphaerochaeta sp.]PKL29291.1 MAG: branched-chain-amino-acid transaminase [Spirochaetae bacterium HGW-Spirochaetae-2]
MSEQTVYLEGAYIPLSEAKIPIMDHGLLYGDGIFEGIRAYGGRVFKLDDHMKRFQSAARAINLQLPLPLDEITEIVLETCRRNNIVDGYVRLVCTRGADGLGLYPKPEGHAPRLFCIAGQVALYSDEAYRRGLKVITSHLRRNKAAILDPQIKSLNYLNNILASIEAHRYGADEALMLNEEGVVTECTGDNVFLVKNGVILTPPVWLGTLDGITRQSVIKICKQLGVELREEPFTHFNLINADEAFLTGTAAEIIALTELDGQKIGNGVAGEVTLKLLAAFREYVLQPENGAKI